MCSMIGWRSALWLFMIAFTLRLAAILLIGPTEISFGDARDHLNTARYVCTEGSYPDRGNLPFFRAPGLPLFIAAVTACNTNRSALVKYALAFMDSLTVLFVLGLGVVITADRLVGLMAGIIAASHPGFIYYVTDIRSEPLCMFFITAALYFFFIARRANRIPSLLIAGSLLGFAALTRPAAVVAIPFFAVAWALQNRMPRRSRVLGFSLIVAAGLLTLAPWAVFISVKHGQLILVNDGGGYNFWRGSHPELYRASTAPDRRTYLEILRHFEEVTTPTEAAEVSTEADSPIGRSRSWVRRAFRNVAEHPETFVRFTIRKLPQFWRPWLNPLMYSSLAVFGSASYMIALFLLASVGILLLRRRHRWVFSVIVLWLIFVWLIHIPFHVGPRHRVPFSDPLLVVLSAFTVVTFLFRGLGRFVRLREERA